MANTNIDYWKRILDNPNPIYGNIFNKEKVYLNEHISKDSSVLDVGCGDGRIIEYILPITKNITGVDIDTDAVQQTKARFKDISTINIQEGDIFNLPFPDNSFDIALLMLTLVNLDDRKIEALKEMKRVIKDSGKLIISVYSEDALENRLEQYKAVELPIKEILKSKVTLEGSMYGITSEQLSLSDIEQLGKEIGMKVGNVEKIPGIAYIFEFTY